MSESHTPHTPADRQPALAGETLVIEDLEALAPQSAALFTVCVLASAPAASPRTGGTAQA